MIRSNAKRPRLKRRNPARGRHRKLKRIIGAIAVATGVAVLAALAVGAIAWNAMRAAYSDLPGYQAAGGVSDRAQGKHDAEVVTAESDFAYPTIDWSYWQMVNPDIAAWITIPGTSVDFPVAYAPKDDPDYYLEHDANGNLNYFGCIFIDSACTDGLEACNCILYGHNMAWDDSMFGPLE